MSLESAKKWNAENPERRLKWRLDNLDKQREYNRRYREKHRDKIRGRYHKRGYLTDRRRVLGLQRTKILDQLEELRKESGAITGHEERT